MLAIYVEIAYRHEEQDGCCRNSRGKKDWSLTDKAVMKNSSKRKVGLSMVWIDYQKAYDMDSWIHGLLVDQTIHGEVWSC